MSEGVLSRNIRALSKKMLQDRTVVGDLIFETGKIEKPVAVNAPDISVHSWVVPVTSGNKLAGYFHFTAEGTYMSYVTFQHHADSLEECPETATWLDTSLIQLRGMDLIHKDETAGRPFLTYDRTPARIVWAVPLINKEGQVRNVYVAGRIAYLPSSEESWG